MCDAALASYSQTTHQYDLTWSERKFYSRHLMNINLVEGAVRIGIGGNESQGVETPTSGLSALHLKFDAFSVD